MNQISLESLFILVNEHNWHDLDTNPCYEHPSMDPNGFESRRCYGSAFCNTICIPRWERMNQPSMKYCICLSIGFGRLNGTAVLVEVPTEL